MSFEGIKTTEWLFQEQKEADKLRKKIKKIEKLCYKVSEEMGAIDKLPTGQDKLIQRAIELRFFWAEVCLIVVPQYKSPVPNKSVTEK
jgi:hypothetical protein